MQEKSTSAESHYVVPFAGLLVALEVFLDDTTMCKSWSRGNSRKQSAIG